MPSIVMPQPGQSVTEGTVLKWLKHRYQMFVQWFKRQGIVVKVAGFLFTTAVTVATLWLLGALDFAASWVGLDRPWLKSPIGF